VAAPQRFFDPSQPQMLQSATFRLYLEAVFGLLAQEPVLILAGYAAGGFGIANGKKWGYGLAVASVAFRIILYFAWGLGDALRYDTISVLFTGVLAALLLHPQSREYQRIWFN
jgi:hypothetical protein